jgi:hypothetical protein
MIHTLVKSLVRHSVSQAKNIVTLLNEKIDGMNQTVNSKFTALQDELQLLNDKYKALETTVNAMKNTNTDLVLGRPVNVLFQTPLTDADGLALMGTFENQFYDFQVECSSSETLKVLQCLPQLKKPEPVFINLEVSGTGVLSIRLKQFIMTNGVISNIYMSTLCDVDIVQGQTEYVVTQIYPMTIKRMFEFAANTKNNINIDS